MGKQIVVAYFDAETIQRIDAVSASLAGSRSQAMRYLVAQALDTVEARHA